MNWTEEAEARLIHLRDVEGKTYREISEELGTTISSVKHKYIRLKQASNDDRHHHPIEKTVQVESTLGEYPGANGLRILEANAGWGNLTQVYMKYGTVYAQDIDGKRTEYLKETLKGNLDTRRCDSFEYMYKQVYDKEKFDVIDLDPYGYPSRYFPHVFQLIDDGYLFVTFPKIGVQQLNKITIEHLRVFWGLTLADTGNMEAIVDEKLRDYGMQSYRRVELVSTVDLGRMYRFAYKVTKESALTLVGLTVKGKND